MFWCALVILMVWLVLLCIPRQSAHSIWLGSLYLSIKRGRNTWTLKDKSLNECTVFVGIQQCTHRDHPELQLYQLIFGSYLFSTSWHSKGV